MIIEKEKAAKGQIYDANNDARLQEEMFRTRCKLHEFNSLSPAKIEEREELIHSIVNMKPGRYIILPSVTIGDNTVIAAGTVVNRDVPSGMLIAGNPCKIVREINQEEEESKEDYRPKKNLHLGKYYNQLSQLLILCKRR